MFKVLLSTAIAGLVALGGASVANATETAPVANDAAVAPIDIRMSPLTGLPGSTEYYWTSYGEKFQFEVLLTHVGEERERGVTVFLSVPEALDVQSWGDRWSCEDTVGGIDCHHPDLVVPDEAWPVLYFEADPDYYAYIEDTIDVYATTADYEFAHEGVHYINDSRR
ncbi:hypothetical protein [Saccharothrix hoggarensis]|uniref:Uncharacterized protein n=1 Tax=Saccharothrix hoggarensis TaxID=913853 RepID=A0ABW3QU45_9PSEU